MQDYKSLRVAVMICATLVNTQTHTHTHTHRERERERALTGYTAQPAELKAVNYTVCYI